MKKRRYPQGSRVESCTSPKGETEAGHEKEKGQEREGLHEERVEKYEAVNHIKDETNSNMIGRGPPSIEAVTAREGNADTGIRNGK